MPTPLSRVLLPAIALLAFALPATAFAQAKVTYNPTNPPGGVQIFAIDSGNWGAGTMSNFWSFESGLGAYNLKNDLIGGGSTSYGKITASNYQSGIDSFAANSPADDVTIQRVCQDLDADEGPNPTNANVSFTYGQHDNPHDSGDTSYIWCPSGSTGDCQNAYSYPSWVLEQQDNSQKNPSGDAEELNGIVCDSNALPANTLTANNYYISAGANVKLSWDDSAPRDQITSYDAFESAYYATSCTSTGFTVPSTETDYCLQTEKQCSGGNNASADLAAGGNQCTTVCIVSGQSYRPNPVSGNITVSPNKTTTYKFTCTNPNGTTVASATVNVNQDTKPDLVGQNTTTVPASPTAGQSVTLKSSDQNNGAAASTDSKDLFEIYLGSTKAGKSATQPGSGLKFSSLTDTVGPDVENDPLSYGETNNISDTYTFPYAGTWWVRTCVNMDKNGNVPPASGGVQNEDPTALNNNCGNWTEVDVLPGASLSISPATITLGNSTTLDYECDEGTAGWSQGGTAVITSNNNAGICNGTTIGSGYTIGTKFVSGTDYTNVTCTPMPSNYTASPKTNLNYTLTCTDANGNVGTASANNLTINAPDLLVSKESGPSSATQGSPVTLSGLIYNEGNIGTNKSPSSSPFPNLLDIQEKVGGTWTDVPSLWQAPTMSALASGADAAPAFTAVTFPDAATYQWRICADNNTSWAGTVVESDDGTNGNNCGAWNTITMTVAGQPSVSCSPDDQQVSSGGQASWTASPANGATSPYTWKDGFGTTLGTGLTYSNAYTANGAVTVTASDGHGGQVTSPACTVEVSQAPGGSCTDPATIQLGANPTLLPVNNNGTTLTWKVSNAVGGCTLVDSAGNNYGEVASPPDCSEYPGSLPTGHKITGPTIFTLSCSNGTAYTKATIQVGVSSFTEF